MNGETQLKSIRVERVADRVNIVMANGTLGMTRIEAISLRDALQLVAQGLKDSIELWSEGTIGEKVEA